MHKLLKILIISRDILWITSNYLNSNRECQIVSEIRIDNNQETTISFDWLIGKKFSVQNKQITLMDWFHRNQTIGIITWKTCPPTASIPCTACRPFLACGSRQNPAQTDWFSFQKTKNLFVAFFYINIDRQCLH